MNARVSGEIGSITKYATLGIALWAISPFALHAFGQAENSPLPLSGPDALVAEFNRNQEIVGLITFPGAGIVGFHGGIEVFDPTLFPSEFIAALISEDENGVPIYEIAVIEDPLTRDRVFFNAHGIPFYSAPAPPDYDPFRFAPPQIEKKAGSLADYDSSRVYVTFDLVDLQDVEALESSSAPETGEVGISGAAAAAGGGGAQSASSSVFSVVSMTCDATNAYVTFPASTQMYYGTQAKIPGTTQGWQYVEILTGEEGMMTCPVTMGTPADPCRNYRVIEQTVSTPIASLTGPDPVIEIEPQLTVTPPSFACVGDLVALELELDP